MFTFLPSHHSATVARNASELLRFVTATAEVNLVYAVTLDREMYPNFSILGPKEPGI